MAARSGLAPTRLTEEEEETLALERWRLKKLVERLTISQGSGTSMVTLSIPPTEQISRMTKLLDQERQTASNIKSRKNRQSVQRAITSAREILRNYSSLPANGLVILCGTVDSASKGETFVKHSIEPFKPVSHFLYRCDSRFHLEPLIELLRVDENFGVIVMTGDTALFGLLLGNTRKVLQQFHVDLPKKHSKGGQSAQRFGRIREERRHNYVRKVAEHAAHHYLGADYLPTVSGLILAGFAEFKSQLEKSQFFAEPLRQIVLNVVDVNYGGVAGLDQAIELSQPKLQQLAFIREKTLIDDFFEQIARETGKFCFGLRDVLSALDMNVCAHVIMWEDFPVIRYTLRDPAGGAEQRGYRVPPEDGSQPAFRDEHTGTTLEITDQILYAEWLSLNRLSFGTKLTFVTDKSAEGSRFVKGVGGIGALLRYRVDTAAFDAVEGLFDEAESGGSSESELGGSDDDAYDPESDFM